MRDCPTCGTPVSDEARYCAECGRALPGRGALLDEPLLEQPSLGLWPPDPAALVAVLVAVGGIILAAGGEWAWAAVAFLVAAVVVLVRAAAVGGRGRVLANVRARAAATREAMAARSREQVGLFRARRELAELEAERARLFRDFGYAVYVADETGMDALRGAIDGIGERVAEKEAEIEAMRRETEERIERAQGEVRPTERMEAPPEPARVPEPWPPPDEGEIPDPAPTPPRPTPEEPPEPVHPPAPQTGEQRPI